MTMTRSRRPALLGSHVLIALAVLLVMRILPATGGRASAQPRPVAQRGELLPAERTTIELFERTRSSVTFITTQALVPRFPGAG